MKALTYLAAGAAILALVLPGDIFAATQKTPAKTIVPAKPFYSGWIPFWKKTDGTAETAAHLRDLQEINPFSFEIDPTLGVIDKMGASQEPWTSLVAQAQSQGVKVVPSVASMDGNLIHKILSNRQKRYDHIQDILGTIFIGNYDGIDIDYEGKKVETKPYFSAFIKELSATLHKNKKVLSCTVESRTPLSSRFNVDRPPMEYANDYAVLNKYCDEVKIMAYDQANIDLKLNKSKGKTQAYLPVADPDWVQKTIQEALKSISSKKLVLGIPTYGYEYLWSPGKIPTWDDKLRSLTYTQAMAIATTTGMTPVRNSAGELSFMYVPGLKLGEGAAVSSPTSTLNQARIVWFTDAKAISQKLALVKKYKLKGAAFFKFDGQSDPAFWNLISS